MTNIETLKTVVGELRAGIADGTKDLDAVDSGLQRVENLLGGEWTPRAPHRERSQVVDEFWAKKARKKGWAKK